LEKSIDNNFISQSVIKEQILLNKSLRRRLLEQKDWDKALRKIGDKNPNQTWRRTRDRLRTEMNDLILMAEILPEEKQEELFDHQIVARLVRAILGYYSAKELQVVMKRAENPTIYKASHGLRNPWERDLRRTMIAGDIAKSSLNFCGYQLQLVEEVHTFIDPVVQIFEQAAAMAMMMNVKVERQFPLPALINSERKRGNEEDEQST